ncbi:hypothetical protein C923_04298 [Plasmodium falciparum UGT5.1]|uniref:Plasmodium RESA N-terminal domain-containing protein n=1 Tax=Plasmodium falciparum UGT5.1 TaxID=1237627 RepID=W7J7S0_PLAFA|nr:hypothetical protein C923_04298 [Plasmodium falciparum UGT5.1]
MNIIICDKSETMYSGVYHIYIYRRNLSESKSVKNKGLRNKSEKNKLKNGVDEKNDSTPLNLYNIWSPALGIAKNAFDEMIKDLWLYIEDYLNKYEYQRYHHIMCRRPVCVRIKYRTLYKSKDDIGVALSSTDMQHTLNFYSLVKNGESIDEMKKFIYSYIKCYDTLQNDLFNEHRKICTGRVRNSKGLDM